MSLQSMDAATMISVSEPWVNPAGDRPFFEAYPLIAGLAPVLTTTHDELLRVRGTPDENRAQSKWIRTVNILCELLALESEIPDVIRGRILHPLRSAEAEQSR